MIYLNEATNIIQYRRTLIEDIMEDARPLISDLHANLLSSLISDYKRNLYLSKSLHRQATQIVHLWCGQLKAAGLQAQEAIDQAKELDQYSEWLSSTYRAESKKGMVEKVSPTMFDYLLAHEGRMPGG